MTPGPQTAVTTHEQMIMIPAAGAVRTHEQPRPKLATKITIHGHRARPVPLAARPQPGCQPGSDRGI
jgi:hypothetical protein